MRAGGLCTGGRLSMRLEVENETRRRIETVNVARVAKRARVLLHAPRRTSVSLFFVSDTSMRKLNRRTRAINTAADVLAFPLHHRRGRVSVRDADPDGVVRLGDVVISFDTARRQARQRGVSINEEIAELFAHGLLHLLGYDHKTRRESEAMERLTRRLLGGHESGAKV